MKKKRELVIHIHLTNRWLYTFIAIGILVIIGVGVYALTPGVAPNPGHLISDVAPPSPCTARQVLSYNGTNWKCISSSVGAVTSSKWCVGDGTAVQCNQDAPPTKGTTAMYNVTNSHCLNVGLLTIASTCSTSVCGGSPGALKYYSCNGACSSFASNTCPNTLLGYLVN